VRRSAYLWFDNLQIPDLNAGSCEVGNFELDIDRALALARANTSHASTKAAHHTSTFLIVSSHGGKTKLCTHEKFLATAELLYLPYYR
jgi:hypothetical protein